MIPQNSVESGRTEIYLQGFRLTRRRVWLVSATSFQRAAPRLGFGFSVEGEYEPMRSNPRFAAALKRINLAPI